MGYVDNPDGVTIDWIHNGDWEIEVALRPLPATASLRSWYDPGNERVRM